MRLRLLKLSTVRAGSDLRVLAGYCLASAIYIAIGVTWVDFLLSVVGRRWRTSSSSAWLVPTLIRRLLD